MANWTEFRPTELLRALVVRGVDFVVVGGVAMIGHGSSRPTYDVDICYATDSANLEGSPTCWSGSGRELRGIHEEVPFVPDARTLRQASILTLTTPEGEIDLLVGPAGAPAYAELRHRARRITLDGIAVLIASLDDLESMKRAAGRPKDLLDLEEIAAIRRLRQQLGRD